MNKEKLNETMNCQCLQSIIENDKNKHSREEDRFDIKTIQIPNNCGEIIFECFTSYRHKTIDSKNHIVKDKNEKDFCGVPFFYCPICGSKTKLNTEKSFYEQFQK